MTRIKQGIVTLLNAKAATGKGVALDVSNYKTVLLQLSSTGSADATIKLAASMSREMPDFTIAPSASNPYSYVQCVNLDTGSSLNGSTGIVLSGTDATGPIYEVNTNLIKWLCPIVTAYSAGALTMISDATNDYTR